jgi:HEAT repeat protein
LTKEQRDLLPPILAAIGPSAIPALIRHLLDPDDQMRAIAVAALGHLHTRDEIPLLVHLAQDPSDLVRQNLVESLGRIGTASPHTGRTGRRVAVRLRIGWVRRWFAWKKGLAPAAVLDPIHLAILTLRDALNDHSAAVRTHAARALGSIGPAAAAVAPGLIALLKDPDEKVRCEAAESLGKVKGSEQAAVNALVDLLQDVTPLVRASAARALGTLKNSAAPAVSALVPLLQDQEESVRTAAAEAIAQVGPLNEANTDSLVEGLASPDNVVRAQTAQALGTIGAPAQQTAAALVEALGDSNDRVRAKAVQALGKIGEGAATVAVPSLVLALRDQDNWVSALAAEALGQMGDSADEAVPALIRSLRHINPHVRGNAAESLGKMGAAAERARSALEISCRDEDGGVRSQALRALGALGSTGDSWQAVLTGLQDADPQVRTAAVQSMGNWGEPKEEALRWLVRLLEDANEQVRMQVADVLPKLAGATSEVIEGLCRRLLEDDSVLIQFHVAQALSKLGPAAAAAGGALLCVAQTAEVTVREQAMRAIAMIQPPEAGAAFTSGLKDADGEIRKMASAGWMKAAAIPEAVVPALIEALRDPEIQVRANASHALARLDVLPVAAIPSLIACTGDANDGLRINAALALKLATGNTVALAMEHLVEDANLRICLIAASWLLSVNATHAQASAVVRESLGNPTVRLRQAALALLKSLGPGAATFLDIIRSRTTLEEEPELREALAQLAGQLDVQPAAAARVALSPEASVSARA